jgi:hypothetical protein
MRLLLLGVAALAAWPASGSAPCPPPPARRSRAARPRRGGLGGAGHLARPGHQRVARRRRHLVAPGIGAHPGLVGRADHGAACCRPRCRGRPPRGLGPGGNTAQAGAQLRGAERRDRVAVAGRAVARARSAGSAGTRPGIAVSSRGLLRLASTPAGGNAGKHAAKRGPGDEANGEPMGRSVNRGCMSHAVPGSSWLLAQDTSIVPAGAGLAGWAWAE